MAIKQLSLLNCTEAESFLSTKLDNFNIKKLLKDFPLPKESTTKDFMNGKLAFFRLFVSKQKADFHVHFSLKIESEKRRNVHVNIEFCKNPKHFKQTIGKKKKNYSYFEDLPTWLSEYFFDVSKVNIYSLIEYTFSNKQYKTIFNLPFPLEVQSDQIGFKDIKVSGLKLQSTDSKLGVNTIFVDTDGNNISVYINTVAKHFDQSYFDSIFESTSKFANIFIKEFRDEKSI